jgi:hypothetical protein
MNILLPPEIAKGASLRGNEYGWPISAFPAAFAKARSLGFACLGGQFQFRSPGNTCEMYRLSANPTDRRDHEPWSAFSHRSCSEVVSQFKGLVSKTDFGKEPAHWKLDAGAVETLVFVAYFESQSTCGNLNNTTAVS